MESTCKVTVVVSTYNQEKYIEHALESILMQETDFNFDILIHDDASTDSTDAIILSYLQRYPSKIRYIHQRSNQYSLKNVNAFFDYILPEIKAQYIAFCEGDDFWIDKNKLQKQYNVLEQHQEFSGVSHRFYVVDVNENIISKCLPSVITRSVYTYKDAERGAMPGQTASFFFRLIYFKKYISRVNMDKDLIRYDTDLCVFLSTFGPIYIIDEYMSGYRYVTHGGDNWSTKNYKKNITLEKCQRMEKIQKFLLQEFNKALDFSFFYAERLSLAIKFLILSPNKENYLICRSVLNYNRPYYKLLFVLPYIYLHKILFKIKRKINDFYYIFFIHGL